MGRAAEVHPASYSAGTTVAVYLPQYRDELPLIGKITHTRGEIVLHWYVGTYYGPWRPCKRHESSVDWVEKVFLAPVLCTVSLSKSFRLSNALVLTLKAAYKKFNTLLVAPCRYCSSMLIVSQSFEAQYRVPSWLCTSVGIRLNGSRRPAPSQRGRVWNGNIT